jgi:hypothetical protein
MDDMIYDDIMIINDKKRIRNSIRNVVKTIAQMLEKSNFASFFFADKKASKDRIIILVMPRYQGTKTRFFIKNTVFNRIKKGVDIKI